MTVSEHLGSSFKSPRDGSEEKSLALMVTLVVAVEGSAILGAFDLSIEMRKVSSSSVSPSSVITMAAV